MRFELIVLGSSAAAPAYGRFCSGQLLCLERHYILIDCGEGTQLQLQKAKEGLGKLSHILITHLHGDHYFGLPGLLTSLALGGRKTPLTIISPPGLKKRILGLLEYDKFPAPFPITFIEQACVGTELLLETESFSITGFPLRHRITTNGYLVREQPRLPNMSKSAIKTYSIPFQAIPDIKSGSDFVLPNGEVIPNIELVTPAVPARSFAYCSDTLYFAELAEVVRGVDLLYHEATFTNDALERALETGHSTAAQAGELAKLAEVKQLIIGHFSARYDSLQPLLEEAQAVFTRVKLARALERHLVAFRPH